MGPCGLVLAASLTLLAVPARAASAAPAPRLVAEPAHLEFPAGGGSRTVVLQNRGDAPLNIYYVRVSADAMGFAPGPGDVPARRLLPGAALTLEVTYTADLRRRQAFGGLQIGCDDPRGLDDPRTPEREYIVPVALSAGSSPLLTIMVLSPLLGLVVVLLLRGRRERFCRLVALGGALVPLLLSGYLYQHLDRGFGTQDGNYGIQFITHEVLVPGLHLEYYLGVDGLSAALVGLTAFLSVIAILAAEQAGRGTLALLLLLESGALGVFCALDALVFLGCWAVVLLSTAALIGGQGGPGPGRRAAARRFLAWTLPGLVLVAAALLTLHARSIPAQLIDGTPVPHTLDLVKLTYQNYFGKQVLLGLPFDRVMWVVLVVGLLLHVPAVPGQSWLGPALVEAPAPVALLLGGVVLKIGVYGILRLAYGILPEASGWGAGGLAGLGVLGMVVGTWRLMGRGELQRLLAPLCVAHLGYCLLGMAAFTQAGIGGALLQGFNHGVLLALLVLLLAVPAERGVAVRAPWFVACFCLGWLAALGLPGLASFTGEVMVLIGAFPAYRGLVVVGGLSWLGGIAGLQRVLSRVLPGRGRISELTGREAALILPLLLLVIGLGVCPAPLLGLQRTAVNDLITHTRGHIGAGSLAWRFTCGRP